MTRTTHDTRHTQRKGIPLSPPHIAIAEQNAVPEERLEFLVVALEEGTTITGERTLLIDSLVTIRKGGRHRALE